MSIKCLVCGHQNADGATICINCGTPLETQAAAPMDDDDGGDATMLLDPNKLKGLASAPRSSAAAPKLPKPPPAPEPRTASPPPPPELPDSYDIEESHERVAPPPPPAKAAAAPPPAGKPPVAKAPEPVKPRPSHDRPSPDPIPASALVPEVEEDPPASPGARIAAVLIDGFVAAILFGILSFFVMSEDFFDKDVIGMMLDLRVSFAIWIIAMTIYFGFMTSTAGGQTLGKKAMGIRVINAEGFEEVNIGMALTRGLLKAVGYAIFPIGVILLLPALITPARRGVHDLMTGTRVVQG